MGTGIDFYGQRSVPLFVDLRKELTSKANTPFIYADGGLNFRWLKSNSYFKDNSTSSPGLYYDLGLGWKVKTRHTGIIICAGYSYKQVKEKVQADWYMPVGTLGEDSFEKHDYRYRRIVVKMGIQL